jgi:hypothetical protein
MMSVIHQAMTHRALKVAVYVRDDLWRFSRCLPVPKLPSREEFQEKLRHGHGVEVRSLLVDGSAIAVYFLASLAAAIAVSRVSAELHAAAWCLTAITLAAPLIAPVLSRRLSIRNADAVRSPTART